MDISLFVCIWTEEEHCIYIIYVYIIISFLGCCLNDSTLRCGEKVHHLSRTRVEYFAASPLSSLLFGSTGGLGVLWPWKNKPPTGVTVSSLPSSNLDHTHVWRVGVQCQISAGLIRGGCGAGLWGPDGPPAPAEDPGVWDTHNNTLCSLTAC